jgi:hypothetical protein
MQDARAMNVAEKPVASHRLCFVSLFQPGRGLCFPCDSDGEVQLDALSERARNNYLLAREVVGCDYGVPKIVEA